MVKTIGIVRKEIYLDSLFEYIYFLNCIINQKIFNILKIKFLDLNLLSSVIFVLLGI